MKRYQVLSRAIGARGRCEAAGNTEWFAKWDERIKELVELLPHGSGFDSGTKLDESSTSERLVFNTAFHHMNESGMYDGWTEHQVIVLPSLEIGFHLKISGRNRNEIKEYIAEQIHYVLDADETEFKAVEEVAQAATVGEAL